MGHWEGDAKYCYGILVGRFDNKWTICGTMDGTYQDTKISFVTAAMEIWI